MFSLSELSLVFKFSVLLQNLILNNESYCSKCQFFFFYFEFLPITILILEQMMPQAPREKGMYLQNIKRKPHYQF